MEGMKVGWMMEERKEGGKDKGRDNSDKWKDRVGRFLSKALQGTSSTRKSKRLHKLRTNSVRDAEKESMTRENTGHVDEPKDGEEERRGHVDEPQREDEGQADVPEDLADELPVEYKLLQTMEEFDWDGAYKRDPVFQKIYKKCSMNNEDPDGYSISGSLLQFTTSKGIRTCIPTTLLREVLHIAHDTLGHGGYTKTYDRIPANYYRPKLAAYIEDYVARCPKCTVNKIAQSKLPGNLLPIDATTPGTPLGAFKCVGIDFIVQLPKSEGFDAIMVIIDKFT